MAKIESLNYYIKPTTLKGFKKLLLIACTLIPSMYNGINIVKASTLNTNIGSQYNLFSKYIFPTKTMWISDKSGKHNSKSHNLLLPFSGQVSVTDTAYTTLISTNGQSNLDYLKSPRQYLKSLLTQICNKIDKNDKESLDGTRFLDWQTLEKSNVTNSGLHSMCYMAVNDAFTTPKGIASVTHKKDVKGKIVSNIIAPKGVKIILENASLERLAYNDYYLNIK